MDLYFLRHAEAVERIAGKYEKDSERPLTSEGRKTTVRVARAMKALDLSFDLVLASPFARAYETAQIVARRFRAKSILKVSEHLAPDGSPERLIEEINSQYVPLGGILLVGHEPYLSGLISLLLGGNRGCSLTLKKAALCMLTVEKLRCGRCAELEWLLQPGHLKLLR